MPSHSTDVLLKAFFDGAPALMGVVQVEGRDIRHLSDNTAACRFFGVGPGATVGRLASELGMPRQALDLWVRYYQTAERTRISQVFEYLHMVEGRAQYLQATVTFLEKTPEGHFKCCYVVSDVTELRLAYQSLKVLQEREASTTFEHAGVGLAHVGLDGRFLRVNQKYCEITGYTAEELYQKKFWAISHLDDVPPALVLEEALLRGEKSSYSIEKRYFHKSGKVVWVNLTGALLKNHDGSPRCFIKSIIDVTERKEAEQMAHRSEQQLQAIIDGAPNMVVFLKDPQGRYITVNRNFENFLGTTRDEIRGKNDFEIGLSWEQAETVRANDYQVLESMDSISFEETVQCADGQERIFLATKFPLLDQQRRPYAVCGVAVDITERQRAEKQLAHLFEGAQQALRIRDEFLSIASHELKTPLTALKLQQELVRRTLEKPGYSLERVRQLNNDTSRQVDRLNRLIEDLLDVSRIQTGKLVFHFEAVNASMLVQEVVERLSPQLSQAGCEVLLDLQPNLVAHWDRMRVEQVVWNLLANVLKYAPGCPVELKTVISGAAARIEVRDQGPGIPKDKLEVIFDRFERGIAGLGTSGLGLGLFIVRSIAQGHGGRVWAESGLGRGSSFIVELPLFPACPAGPV